jgi:upstream activation factor subunit UAF30
MAPKKKTNVTQEAKAETTEPQVVEPTQVETEPGTEVVEKDKFAVVLEKLYVVANEVKEVIATVKQLQKEHARLQKQTNKKAKKASTGQRTLSGFAKPSLLSNELCDFMGIAHGTSLARTEVTRMINEYIKKNNLQNETDKRHIIPDEKLKAILNLSADDKLTYFNLQKYMKHHFTKEA